MTAQPQPGFGVDEPSPAHGGAALEPWRLAVSALIVVVVVAAIWLWGRPHREPPRALVAVTAEAWFAGQPPGAFEAAEVPQEVSAQFADPDSIAGSIAAFDVPAGTFVTPALLGTAAAASGAHTVMRLSADTSAWPEPGPGAGSRAVVAGVLGGCALDVTTLAGGAEGSIVVRVDPADAARYAHAAELDGLVVWPAPPDGWPACRPAPTGAEFASAFGGQTSSGLGSQVRPGFADGVTPSGFGSQASSGLAGEVPSTAPSSESAGG